ncbi:hypothetical protein BH23GEM1_BH23GEM1_06580 [soil metagenome]
MRFAVAVVWICAASLPAGIAAQQNVDNWKLPTPSAYTAEEIEAVRQWVSDGGSLLLVADHMPFPGATAALACALGFTFANNFAIDTATWEPIVFRSGDADSAASGAGAAADGHERSQRAPESAVHAERDALAVRIIPGNRAYSSLPHSRLPHSKLGFPTASPEP